MKATTLIICFTLITCFGHAQETLATEKGITITVTVDNLTSDEGQANFALHTADTFMKGPGIKNKVSEIKDGRVTITFKNVPAGTYAVLGLHDANRNNRMDYEANGMPKESYGTSGNNMSYGPPQFDTAKFVVANENLNMNIRF